MLDYFYGLMKVSDKMATSPDLCGGTAHEQLNHLAATAAIYKTITGLKEPLEMLNHCSFDDKKAT